MINEFSVANHAPYSSSKAAVNVLVAKYNTAYRSQGILFMSISPGFVNTSEGKPGTCILCCLLSKRGALTIIPGKLKGYEKMVTGRISVEDIVEKGFKELINNKDKHIKIMVSPKKSFST